MKKLKVLTVGNSPKVKGGITSVINQIMEHKWDTENVSMKFIATYLDTNNIVKVLYFILAYIKILVVFLFDKPDVAHIHMSYKGSFSRKFQIHKLCKLFKVKDIIHLHGSEFEKWFNESDTKKQEQIKTLLKECSSFIVLGQNWEKAIKNIEPKTNVVVVKNSVAIPKEKCLWNDEKFTFLFLGVLIKRKGVHDLLSAIKSLKVQNKLNNLEFLIAGTGKEQQELQNICKEYELDNYVKFIGWIDGDKKRELLINSQVLVLPSYNEGLPIAILEAISYGLPVIATDVGDISSAVKDQVNGFLINPGDCETLAQSILKISEDKEYYQKNSNKSLEIAKNDFSDEKYFGILKDCYIK
ncbi:MAG: glycosyltransferase family 4 protein [Clostridia bacterium]